MTTKGAAAVLIACACAGSGTQVDVVSLSGQASELANAFSTITSVVEIDDGRVLVADGEQKALWVADFATGRSSELGRIGSGPAEYRSIGHLVRTTGDTTLIDDYANGRFGVLVGAALTQYAVPRRDGAEFIIPRQADARGRLYSQEPIAEKDSVAVLRWDPQLRRLDTVAYLDNRPIGVSTSGSGSEVTLTENFPKFPPTDVWGVLGDGTVMIARVRDHRVDIRTVQRDSVGPARSVQMQRNTQIHAVWGRRPTVSPDGRFWAPRTSRNDDAPEVFDLFDARGALVMRVALPPRCTYVGFGTQSIYVVRSTATGEMLVRYPLP